MIDGEAIGFPRNSAKHNLWLGQGRNVIEGLTGQRDLLAMLGEQQKHRSQDGRKRRMPGANDSGGGAHVDPQRGAKAAHAGSMANPAPAPCHQG